MVFNHCMQDSNLIDRLGGPAKVAELLGFGRGGVQRVHNWRARGIPARVKLEHGELFKSEITPPIAETEKAA